jgi:dUTP pyrophosphatase
MEEYNNIYFAKTHPEAIIPTKREEDAGYDLYARFDEESVIILPGQVKMISTNIVTAFDKNFVMIIKERGSTGSIGMAVRMGIVDSGYRNDIKVGINNTSSTKIIITKNEDLIKKGSDCYFTVYPYKKAIAQALIMVLPRTKSVEITHQELLNNFSSERGTGLLGSTGK